MTDDPLATRRKRLLYQAERQGSKEADLVVGGFARARLAGMSAAELDAFEALIALADADLFSIISGEAAPAGLDGPVLRALREFASRRPN